MQRHDSLDLGRVDVLAGAVGLELSPERLQTLLGTWSTFRREFDRVWQWDLGDRDPALPLFDATDRVQ